jgi:hypothetical protein
LRILFYYEKQSDIHISRFLRHYRILADMNSRIITPLIAVLILSLITSALTYNIAWSDKKYCYDQVGEGHFCFETKNTCKHKEKHDDEAETPCYNKNKQ